MKYDEFKARFKGTYSIFYPMANTAKVDSATSEYYEMLKGFKMEALHGALLEVKDDYDFFPRPKELAKLCYKRVRDSDKVRISGTWIRDDHLVFGDCRCGGKYYHYHNIGCDRKYECDQCGKPHPEMKSSVYIDRKSESNTKARKEFYDTLIDAYNSKAEESDKLFKQCGFQHVIIGLGEELVVGPCERQAANEATERLRQQTLKRAEEL